MGRKVNIPFSIRDMIRASADGVVREYRVDLEIANVIADPESFFEVVKDTATIISNSIPQTAVELFELFSKTIIDTKRAFDAVVLKDVFLGEDGSYACTTKFYALAINNPHPTHLVMDARIFIPNSGEQNRQVLWFPMTHHDAGAEEAFRKYVLAIRSACREILKSHGAVRAKPIYADDNGVIFLHSPQAGSGKLIAILSGGAVVTRSSELNVWSGVPLPEGKLLGWDALRIDPHKP